MPLDLTDFQLIDLARRLYESDALFNQREIGLIIEHWEQAEAATQARWINVARTAMAFGLRR